MAENIDFPDEDEWRDSVDQQGSMEDTILLKEDDELLGTKVDQEMTSCVLSFFHKNSSKDNISLTHPETIKTFKFCDRSSSYEGPDKLELNIETARRLLLQIKPNVESLEFDTIYFRNHILTERYSFPMLQKLHIGETRCTMDNNLEILFSHRFPKLDSLHLHINYLNEKLMIEAYGNFFKFLANHRHTLKTLFTKIYYGVNGFDEKRDLPEFQQELNFDLPDQVRRDLCDGHLQLESLKLIFPPKYFRLWIPIIKKQKKLISLYVNGFARGAVGPTGFPFPAISPGIVSSSSTLTKVVLHVISSVEDGDGRDWNAGDDQRAWIPLDLKVFRDAINLTELNLKNQLAYHGAPATPKVKEGIWITNLNQINSTSLKSLTIEDFFCKSKELQYLVDNAPVIETLVLLNALARRRDDVNYAQSGANFGVVNSFTGKKSKKIIDLSNSLNCKDVKEKGKLKTVRKSYRKATLGENCFICDFSSQREVERS